jgi:hypothetical protein
MTDDMIVSTLERLASDAQASELANDGAQKLERAAIECSKGDNAGSTKHHLVESAEHIARECARQLRDRACERAAQLGWQVATYEIAPEAKASTEAVLFITGNSYMPPLRAYSCSEQVWVIDLPDVWEVYVERLEQRLTELNVYLGSPEDDNSLYVVDLARFEYVEQGTGVDFDDSFAADWKPIADAE